MRTAWIAVSMLLLAAGCSDISGSLRSPNDHMGAPWLVGEPRYPKQELAQGVGGYVDVDAKVDWRGFLEDVKMTPDRPASQPFADAIRDALPMWVFYTPLGEDCMPSGERIRMRAWFEVENGKPKFALSPISPVFKGDRNPRPVHTRDALYPHQTSTFRWHDGVVVFARATIDDSGNVTETTATAYPRGLPWLMTPFEDQVRIALLDFKFQPTSARPGKRYYCTDVVYKAENDNW